MKTISIAIVCLLGFFSITYSQNSFYHQNKIVSAKESVPVSVINMNGRQAVILKSVFAISNKLEQEVNINTNTAMIYQQIANGESVINYIDGLYLHNNVVVRRLIQLY